MNYWIKNSTVFFLLLTQISFVSGQIADNQKLALKTYLAEGNFARAEEIIKTIRTSENNPEWLLFQEANLNFLKGDIKAATNLYLAIYNKNNSQATYALAQCYALLNKPELSVKYLEEYLNQYHRVLPNEIKKNTAFDKIKNSEQWRQLWQNDWYSTYELSLMEADFKRKNKEYSAALNLLDKITEKRSRADEAYFLKAKVYTETENFKQAEKEIDKAVRIEDDNASYFKLKAEVELWNKNPKKALKSIQKALVIDATEIDSYKTLVKVYVALEHFDQAMEYIELLLSLQPSNENLKLAGEVYARANNYLSALKVINQCIKNEKYNPDLYLFRANIYLKTKTYKFAEKDYSMALDFYPYNGEIYYLRGLSRHQQGLTDEACRDWFKARKYGYVNSEEEITKYCRKYLNKN